MLVELETANQELRGALEEKEAALAELHAELAGLRASGWAALEGENAALAAEQDRLTALLAEAAAKARAELEAPTTPRPGAEEGGAGGEEDRLGEVLGELAGATARADELQEELALQAGQAAEVQVRQRAEGVLHLTDIPRPGVGFATTRSFF